MRFFCSPSEKFRNSLRNFDFTHVILYPFSSKTNIFNKKFKIKTKLKNELSLGNAGNKNKNKITKF